MMRRILQPIWVLLAIIFLIEAWLWDHLEPIVAWFVALIPMRAFKEWLAERVDTLSPAMTLIVFIVPVIPLFPLKLVGFWLLTHEYWLSAALTIIFAKFLGVGVAAFVFDVTRPKLLEMAWFEKLYEFVMALRAKATALVDPVKARIVEILRGGGEVALFLGVLGALGQLLGAFASLRLGAVTRRGLLPVVDLLLQRRLGGIVARAGEAYFALVGRRLHRGAADALGLEERPQVRGLDILADRFGLGALAECFRQRQTQRDDRDQ